MVEESKDTDFIETHNKPYTSKHRYWTGLLLIARVILYLVAAANVSNDPAIALLSINFMVCSIVLLKGFIVSTLYRKWSMDVLETFFFLNILFFTMFTWYSLGDKRLNQGAIAYTSVTITFVVLLLIILYHVYAYSSLFSKIKKTKLGRKMDRLFTDIDTEPKPNPRQRHYSPPPVNVNDDDSQVSDDRGELLDDLDGPVDTDDYNNAVTVPLVSSVRMQPTYSVVEVHKPQS